jgi:hypothetical protein
MEVPLGHVAGMIWLMVPVGGTFAVGADLVSSPGWVCELEDHRLEGAGRFGDRVAGRDRPSGRCRRSRHGESVQDRVGRVARQNTMPAV